MLDLQELEAFLAVAEELHFGRAAERLRLSQSRTSRLVARLERRIGASLFERTSRQVTLTKLGQELYDELAPTHARLLAIVDSARTKAASARTQLRLGYHSVHAVGAALAELTASFEEEQLDCAISYVELSFQDPFMPLRRGIVDMLITYRPTESLTSLAIGPCIERSDRVVAVATDHPLATRTHVSIEDLAAWDFVHMAEGIHPVIADAILPASTPEGRTLKRGADAQSPLEIVRLVASGQAVHLTIPRFRVYTQGQPVAFVPVPDLPPLEHVLLWREDDPNPQVRRFASFAAGG